MSDDLSFHDVFHEYSFHEMFKMALHHDEKMPKLVFYYHIKSSHANENKVLFKLGYFGKILAGGALPPMFLLYLQSNYHQTWLDGILGQNLSKTLKSVMTSLLSRVYDVIKQFFGIFRGRNSSSFIFCPIWLKFCKFRIRRKNFNKYDLSKKKAKT